MINFEDIAGKDASSLSGKDLGIETRRIYKLDAIDRSDETVDVLIPQRINRIAPSFVAGMFGSSVKNAKSLEAFFDKFKFKADPRIIEQIQRGARSSLMHGTAFTK